MAKPQPQLDVLVIGDHPSSYLAAALLRHKTKLRVVHSTIPGHAEPDRLVIVNPDLFEVHPLLETMKRKLELNAIYGLQFLSEDPAVRSEHRSKSAMVYVGSSKGIKTAAQAIAAAQDVELLQPKNLQIHRLDANGVDVTIGKNDLRATMLIVAGPLPAAQRKVLSIPDTWESELMHRYTFLKLPGTKSAELGARPTMPMSLNLKDSFAWAWMLPGPKSLQLSIVQPANTVARFAPADLMKRWGDILREAGILTLKGELPLRDAESVDLPITGALAHEGVSNRTLLVGPAGGFYSACSEDIYPNVWSAVFAADTIKKALKEPHLQDALSPYRQKWRTTLGDYLRGPQQDLRFLLPLIFRNQNMTTRMTESILHGKSVVR